MEAVLVDSVDLLRLILRPILGRIRLRTSMPPDMPSLLKSMEPCDIKLRKLWPSLANLFLRST
jgi:hypothetical protein